MPPITINIATASATATATAIEDERDKGKIRQIPKHCSYVMDGLYKTVDAHHPLDDLCPNTPHECKNAIEKRV
ncbi:hypothetical protein C8Q69DRAFT_506746 [Paecilomyces variotii]|uniref:Uncharacterized protein n=1 Tax=Byssochlamys spectabilis TaxID=264951 RepID=A0A443HU85_BYSSP|nr:hypothetical protein C8Q69DRAFT_506746 [Paecilomyces variotii]RWQ95378.1 hypothetical protein C8Q69DRAFT_506746 [Paecilomyces variotii]